MKVIFQEYIPQNIQFQGVSLVAYKPGDLREIEAEERDLTELRSEGRVSVSGDKEGKLSVINGGGKFVITPEPARIISILILAMGENGSVEYRKDFNSETLYAIKTDVTLSENVELVMVKTDRMTKIITKADLHQDKPKIEEPRKEESKTQGTKRKRSKSSSKRRKVKRKSNRKSK